MTRCSSAKEQLLRMPPQREGFFSCFLLFQTEFIKISNQLVISCVNFRRIVNYYCCFLSILINNDEWSNNRIPMNHIEKQWISWTTGGSLETLSFSAVLLEPYRVTMCSSLKTRFEMTDKERFFLLACLILRSFNISFPALIYWHIPWVVWKRKAALGNFYLSSKHVHPTELIATYNLSSSLLLLMGNSIILMLLFSQLMVFLCFLSPLVNFIIYGNTRCFFSHITTFY